MDEELKEILGLLQKLDKGFGLVANRLEQVEGRLAALEEAKTNSPAEPEVHLTSKALTLDKPEDEEVILCLDFGTARSKAFATRGPYEDLVDLAVGQRAGQAQSPHSLLSCVFISNGGRIFFGEVAAAKSEHAVSQGSRQRIDSFKAMVTNASPGSDLRASLCSESVNPSKARLSDGDILTLYLAYLTDMAALELVKRHGISRYVRRRFTTPVFKPEHQKWASDTLRQHYCEAILVADHFSEAWNEGIDALDAERVLRTAASQQSRVAFLTDDFIVEPRAAFASRFRNYEPEKRRRNLISIVDAGAGTIDFATFVVTEDPRKGIQMFLIDGSVHAFRKAGNEVDRILHEYILRQVKRDHDGLDPSLLTLIKANLSLQQRLIKEDLFRTGKRDYKLTDDTAGTIELADFRSDEAIKKFSDELRHEFETALSGMDESWLKECALGKVIVVITGGSGILPMVQELRTHQFRSRSTNVTCSAGPPIPAWVTNGYPELVDEFPQLAVALGGASRDLPAMASGRFAAFEGLADQGRWILGRT
jgi:molecular chaperone HscA